MTRLENSPRLARLAARIAPDVLSAVKRAAEIEGRSVSDFVVAAARAAAERTLTEAQIIRLSLADQAFIADVLARPASPSEGLARAIESHEALIRESP